jgi:hypothetical protein
MFDQLNNYTISEIAQKQNFLFFFLSILRGNRIQTLYFLLPKAKCFTAFATAAGFYYQSLKTIKTYFLPTF